MKQVKKEFLDKKIFSSGGLQTFAFCLCLLLASGCDNMRDNSKLKPYEKSDFFADGSSSRPLVTGTLPQGSLEEDDHLYRGKVDNQFVETFPFPVNEQILARGRERYNIYCIVCHGPLGYGNGMVVQRGFKQPTSFHEERLRTAPAGYFFNVISQGFGVMSSYAADIKAEDRWAIIAYIRTLQLSQNTPLSSLSPEERTKLENGVTAHGESHT